MKLPWYLRRTSSVVLIAGLGGVFTIASTPFAQPWGGGPRLDCSAVAASADGMTLVAAAGRIGSYFASLPAPIYMSTNAGESWTETTSPRGNFWSSVASSADGIKLVAVAGYYGDGSIYISPDAGATWMPASAPTNNWTSVASSADGARLVAVAAPLWGWATSNNIGQGAIYRSSDGGATWVQTTAPNTNWTGVASSADGVKLVAVSAARFDYGIGEWVGGGGIYSSLDSGVTWKRTSAPAMNWSCVASSADGSRLVTAVGPPESPGGLIYTSTNSGATWTATSAPSESWYSVVSSADGTRLVAASVSDIYASSDSGVSWKAMGAPIEGLRAVACSADGYRLVAAGPWCQLCTWPYSGPWRLANAPANWAASLACSADGTKLVVVGRTAGSDAGLLYRSGDSGLTWTQMSAPTNAWSRVASSADGAKLVAVANSDGIGDGAIYRSSNAGAAWSRTSAPSNYWSAIASSADGTKLVAAALHYAIGDGGIYTSSDSGTTWIRASVPTNDWTSVASSADGTKMVAVGEGAIYRSVDAGATWIQASAPSNYLWSSVASSADGAELVALAYGISTNDLSGTEIYTSGDSGVTWEPTSAPIGYWGAVASSADGATLLAVGSVAEEISTNSGVSWAPASAPAGWWGGVASSADGSFLVLVGYSQIATLHAPAPPPLIPPSPQLAVGLSGGNLALSWLVPSTRFVLQQNPDLRSADWMAVPAPPTLNLTNLHNEVILSPPFTGSRFYRLKQY